jgi:Glucose/sorbosone dehydrogenases
VIFTPVGGSIGSNLIDLEFLPGQGGEAIVIGIDGNIYYLNSDFTLRDQTAISVDGGSEQGLLNVVADPGYASNQFIYLYFTVPGSSPDINRVDRFTVSFPGGDFTLGDRQTIIEFNKNQSNSPGDNHNGGSMVFDLQGNLILGVGDGGDGSSTDTTEQIGQNPSVTLGKIHRVTPNRTNGAGSYTVPSGQPITVDFNGGPVVAVDSIYALGVRNPFSSVTDEDGDLFFADVGSGGSGAFEELNCLYFAGENYGWPLFEGPGSPAGFRPPTHGYAHGDTTFDDQDPEPNTGGESIMMNAFYQGSQYTGVFNDNFIYSDFFHGWVRAMTLDALDHVTTDEHIGHLEGLVSLHENPSDGFLYGVSLFGNDAVDRDHVLRMDLAP